MASIQGIYIALFGRPADPAGLAYFNEQTSFGLDLTAIGDLANEAEYQDRFAGMSNAEIINSIYRSLFGRDGEQSGIDFFVAALEDGTYNINNIAIAILDGAQGNDRATVDAKIAAANIFTEHLDQPNEIAAYVGEEAAEIGRNFINGVNSTDAGTEAEADAAILLLLDQQGGQGPGDGDGGGDNPGGSGDNSPFYTLIGALAEPALPAEYRLTLDPGNPEDLGVLNVDEAEDAADIVADANNGLQYLNTTGYDYDLRDTAANILNESGTATVDDAREVIADGLDSWVNPDDLDFSSFSRGVTINTYNGSDDVVGSSYDDTIRTGNGNDFVDGGDGADLIILTENSNFDDDEVVLATNSASVDTIVGFDLGDDELVVADADVTAFINTSFQDNYLEATNGPYNTTNDISVNNSNSYGVIEWEFTLNGGDLTAADDGSELLDGLSSTGTLSSITMNGGAWNGVMVAYQNNTAFVYYASSADGTVTADEINLVAEVQGVALGGMEWFNFQVA